MLASRIDGLRGGVYQVEKGEEETVHLQGFFRTAGKFRLASMKNKFRAKELKGWVDISKSPADAIKYCSKDDTRVGDQGPYYYGECSADSEPATQGKRTDLKRVCEAIEEGHSLVKVAKENAVSFIKYHSGIVKYMQLVAPQKERDFMTELHIYWGAPGTGKSRKAWFEGAGDVYELPKAKEANVIWWPGYTGQSTVILEDYYGWLPFDVMLKMIDRYPYKVRTQDNHWVQFTSKRVIITSNAPWEAWYAKQCMERADWKPAFERRITHVMHFKEGDNWVPPTFSPDYDAALKASEQQERMEQEAIESDDEEYSEAMSPHSKGRFYDKYGKTYGMEAMHDLFELHKSLRKDEA